MELTIPHRWMMLQGYAEARQARCLTFFPTSLEEARAALAYARRESMTVCARAGGLTYDDMILNSNQIVINLARLTRILNFDKAQGFLVVEPGVTYAQLLETILPHHWNLPGCPGEMNVTMGGAIANNAHGKDSWKHGNLGEHVVEFSLLLADGEVITVSREKNPELFRAVIGGQGLFGFVLEAKLKLQKVPSPFVSIENEIAPNFQFLVDKMQAGKKDNDFLITWVDSIGRGKDIGRSVVTKAKWVESSENFDLARLQKSLEVPSTFKSVIPVAPVWFALRPFWRPQFIKYLNAVYFARAKGRSGSGSTKLFTEFNFMHRSIPEMKQVYRPYGFYELQPLIPLSAGAKGLETVVKISQKHGCESLLCGVKLHRRDEFLLSYADDGFSFGIDVQRRGRKDSAIRAFAAELFDYVASIGGRTYLAKDGLLLPKQLRSFYPRLSEFMELKAKWDPTTLFSSDMYRRIFLQEAQ